MFNQTWKKYLPVISILLKRSAKGEQMLHMNHTDFERASGGRKMKFSFSELKLNNGRIYSNPKHLPLAKEFALALQEDEQVMSQLQQKDFEFSMTNNFQLHIKDITAIEEAGESATDQ